MVELNLNGKAIYNYGIYRDCIEFHFPGCVMTITDRKEIETIKRWIKEARNFAKNKQDICAYLVYQIDIGQYEETGVY